MPTGRPRARAELLRERDHFVERRDLKLAVVGVRAERQPLARAQRLDLRQREVFGEPAGDRLAVDGLGPLAIGKPLGDVGRAADLVLVPRDEHAVFGRDEIGLDEVGAHLDRQPVAPRACARADGRWRRGGR